MNCDNKIWLSLFFTIIWTLWQERNSRCFEQKESSVEEIVDVVLLRIGWWVKACWEDFPYSPDEVRRFPGCLRNRYPKATNRREALEWENPERRTLKWNVDASFRTENGAAGIGGILRDWEGKFRGVFYGPVKAIDINEGG